MIETKIHGFEKKLTNSRFLFNRFHIKSQPIFWDFHLLRFAVELINFDNLTSAERAESKQKEAGRITIAKMERIAKLENSKEIAKIMLGENEPIEKRARFTGLSIQEIEKLI